MDSSIRRMLWGAFAALVVLVGVGLALTITVLQVAKGKDAQLVAQFKREFYDIKKQTDKEIVLTKENNLAEAGKAAIDAATLRRSTPDFDGTITDAHRRQQALDLEQMAGMRLSLTLLMV